MSLTVVSPGAAVYQHQQYPRFMALCDHTLVFVLRQWFSSKFFKIIVYSFFHKTNEIYQKKTTLGAPLA